MTSDALLSTFLIYLTFFPRLTDGGPSNNNGVVNIIDRSTIQHGAFDASTEIEDRGLGRSDDFYLETFMDTVRSTASAESSGNLMPFDDEIFYEAVDYESASSAYMVPHSFNVTKNRISLFTPQQSQPSLLRIFRVFAWKGYGLQFEKSVIQWNAFGAAVKVPVSSCFPEWDKNAALPKVSTTFGLNYPYGCKMSMSASVPLGTAIYGEFILYDPLTAIIHNFYLTANMSSSTWCEIGLMLLGKTAGGFKSSVAFSSFLDRLKKQKATDSIKRIGFTATVRFTEEKGLQCSLGPQWFYYPGQMVMQHLLPVIFSGPAILVTLLGLFLNLDPEVEILQKTISSKSDEAVSVSYPNSNFEKGLSLQDTASADALLNLNKMKPSSKSSKKKTNPVVVMATGNTFSKGTDTSNGNSTGAATVGSKSKRRKWKKPKDIRYWHSKILKWANTKSTGLGYNMQYKYQHLRDPSLGSRIVFEIQSFFPFLRIMKMLSAMMQSGSFSRLLRQAPSAPAPIPTQPVNFSPLPSVITQQHDLQIDLHIDPKHKKRKDHMLNSMN